MFHGLRRPLLRGRARPPLPYRCLQGAGSASSPGSGRVDWNCAQDPTRAARFARQRQLFPAAPSHPAPFPGFLTVGLRATGIRPLSPQRRAPRGVCAVVASALFPSLGATTVAPFRFPFRATLSITIPIAPTITFPARATRSDGDSGTGLLRARTRTAPPGLRTGRGGEGLT
ncbi:hypothetical protein AAW14_31200 [Streptomyces hygroscopicus]|nr:hypothetical protein [Streptomyces hygroscopicus]